MVAPKYRALVVDDEEPVRRLLKRALSREGIEADEAADGQQALKLYRAGNYDVVLTDLRMPNRHGHALCVDLLQDPNHPLIIVVTGVVEPRLARDLFARGVDDVVFKPVDFRSFATKIRVLLDARADQTAQPAGSGAATPAPQPARSSDCNQNGPQTAATRQASVAAGPPSSTKIEPKSPDTAEDEQPAVDSNASSTSAASAHQATTGGKPFSSTGKQNLVVILCQERRRCEQLLANLSSDDTDVVVCGSTEELYRWLRERRVDVVVLEQQLDGFLTGLDVLEKMHTDLLRPDAVLIGELDADDMQRAEKLGIEATFPPDVKNENVVKAVQNLLRTRNASNPLIPFQARKLVELYEDIPVLPQLLTKLLVYMNKPSEEIPLKKLADEISVDSRATAEVLRLTNSPALGLGQRVVRVMDAVNLLGPKRTISLILSSAAMHAQSELLKSWSEPIRVWYHRRSVLIASVASVFAKRLERISPNTAFTLGLMQDIGILVLANRGRQRYMQNIVDRARTIGHLELAALEEEAFKLNHGAVSAAVLDYWQLPHSLIRPVLFHHSTDCQEQCDATEKAFLRVMRIGEALADLADVAHASRRLRLNHLLLHYDPKQADLCRECIQLGTAKAREACQLFSVPAPSEKDLQKLLQQVDAAQSSDSPSS